MRILWTLFILAAFTILSGNVQADTFWGKPEGPPKPNRYEPAVLPALGGNSDIGFVFGVMGILGRFKEGYDPYRWRAELIAVASVKKGPEGADFPIQAYSLKLDVPGLADGRVRLIPFVALSKAVSYGYYGIGNASSHQVRAAERVADPALGRHNQFGLLFPRCSLELRVSMSRLVSLIALVGYKYVVPHVYAGSQLEYDAQYMAQDEDMPVVGTEAHGSARLALGIMIDTRDREMNPTRGMYHAFGVRLLPGEITHTPYTRGGASLNFRFYYPLLDEGKLVIAARLLGDVSVGTMPFYESGSADTFRSINFSGMRGIRGIPSGRYRGNIKILGNFEARSLPVSFTLFDIRFKVGAAAFLDTGRVWASFRSRPDLDGEGVGLKWGAGVGPRIQWGETMMMRFDFAFSPNATDGHSIPMAFYMDMAQMF